MTIYKLPSKSTHNTFRDWLDAVSHQWYEAGRIQGWYDEFLVEYGVDPADSPPILREQIFMR